jgi:aminoglycoside phosphotransferase (APT) family kinase protein
MVMDRADGSPLLGGLDRVPVAQFPRLLASIPETLAATMAELHALDPHPVADKLRGCDRAMTEPDFVEALEAAATVFHRSDLADAARWLLDHPPDGAPDVICHGDLHPFNLLVDDSGHVTVLDWSAALIGPRGYDVAFTSLMLAEPPLPVGVALRPPLRAAGALLCRRFVRRYSFHSGATIDRPVLVWHQAVVCLRALVEVAGWVDANTVEGRERHPWLVSGQAFARRLSKITGVPVRAR